MVSLHGHTRLSPRLQRQVHDSSALPPPDPHQLLTEEQLQSKVEELLAWWSDKNQVLCITGAGMSTESGIPDYRGHQGSYHRGHKPMVHDQFMSSDYQRKRYWGRGLVGWSSFDETAPNIGHVALAELEQRGKLGVDYQVDQVTGPSRLALVTQNVDTLHRRAGSQQLIELHGRTDRLQCMKCGAFHDRRPFQRLLESLNREWLAVALAQTDESAMRPDGDAAVATDSYEQVQVPPCSKCGDGFLKPDVVFFGDTVPAERVAHVRAAVEAANGILVVGSSLAVHSVFRHVRAASQAGTPIAILNVGETRAEVEGLDVLKIEAPAGSTLKAVAEQL